MATDRVLFDIWGCRGSRSFLPARSRIGNNTSCYSILHKDQLFVLDAGYGLPALGYAMSTRKVFRCVKSVHLFVSHAHCDHWEGLKDVGWFWDKGNGLDVTLCGSKQALQAIQAGFAHPSYVPLDVLSQGTVGSLTLQPLAPRETHQFRGWKVETFALNHASGAGLSRLPLDTLGYRLTAPGGAPSLCYLLDHEPTPETAALEVQMMQGVHLAVWDAHFFRREDQRFGHGSQEHAAKIAGSNPGALVIAGHHGPMYSDAELRRGFRIQSRGLPNYRLAVEGDGYVWNARGRTFTRSR